MSFLPSLLHPALLWFLPLAAIPIVLHLLTLHRLKTVELSTFRFLFDSYVQQRRKMRFLEALLAMLRTLFLLLLVFLFMRPVLKNWGNLFGADNGSGGREVILLMDCSASMNARSAGVSGFDRAKRAAASVVDRLSHDDRLTLIRVGATPEELFSRFSTDTKGIQDRIDGLKTTSSRANIFAALLQLFGPEASRRSNPIVYLFTDCQSSGWLEVRNQGLEHLIPAGTPFVVVNVGDKEPLANRAVIGDAPRRNRAIAGLPIVLRPHVVNYSKTEKAELTLSVFIDEKEVTRTPLTLKPGESLTRPVDYLPREPGLRRGRFEITGKNADRFPDDDRFLFTLSVEPRVKVVLVNSNLADDPDINEGRYLFTALTSRAEAAADDKKAAPLAASKDFQRSLDVREVAETALNAETLRDASVVVLANCGALNDQQFDWLRNFVRSGGGLLIFPGDKVKPDTYNKGFFPVPGPQGESLTAARLGPAEGDPNKLETFERLAAIDFSHPALSVFNNTDSDARHFKTVSVYKRFKLQLPAKRGNAWPLMKFASGAPALVESRLGDGIVILSAFPAHRRWTNLPVKPDFVPLMLRLTSHVEHRPEVEVSPVVVADSTAEISVSNAWSPAEATVKNPAGHLLPQALERSGARLLGAFERTGERGYYTVDVRGSHLGQPKAASLAFAVNLAPEESDFTMLDEKNLRELLPGAKLTYVDASAEAQHEKGSLGKENEIWPILIWGLFLLIAVEFMFATVSGKRADTDEQSSVRERILGMSPGSWVGRMTGAGRETASEG
ncbi:MAG TPA: VWA domain-containing protein [Gemmataceae bacterium]|nr:VWA domain-containing protein [Gemmataceae bacterium]